LYINTFWKIILKAIGLWLLMHCIWIIPQLTAVFHFDNGNLDWDVLCWVWGISFVTLMIFLLITWVFLFQTDGLVRRLKLDQSFKEDRIDIQTPPKTILPIIITLMGGLYFMQSFPQFFNTVYEFLKQKILFKDYRDSGWMIYLFCASGIGFWVMTNAQKISNYLWKNTSNQ
jgi:hypothetical protein